jgi:hypothetical protein
MSVSDHNSPGHFAGEVPSGAVGVLPGTLGARSVTLRIMGNESLRALLAEAGWRPETFAKRITAYARRRQLRISVHEKTPYSWLRDGRCPHDPIPQLASDVLAEQLGRDLNPADLGWKTKQHGMPRADDGLTDLWFPGGAILGLREVAKAVHRRDFLTLTGSALTTVAHQWMVTDTPRLAAVLTGGSRVDDHLVADFERLADLRRRMDDELGGGALYEAVNADLRLVARILSDARYPETLGRRLYSVAAELARIAGWSCHETGAEGAAQRYWLVALRAAEQAEDKPLGANILMFMGIQNSAVGNPRDSVTLFSSARYAGGSALGATQRAAIASLEAGAHARAGDAHATAARVDEALAEIADSRPADDPAWIYWVTKPQLSGDVGSAFLHLGDPVKAMPYLQSCVDNLGTSRSRNRAHRMVRLAAAQLRTGDADQALTTAHEVADIAARLSSERVREILGDFCREVTGTVGGTTSAELVEHARTALKA